MAVKLQYSIPSIEEETKQGKLIVTSQKVTMEEATPEDVAKEIRSLESQGYEVSVSLKLK